VRFLANYNCVYRVATRNWVKDIWMSDDRNDDRYNLHLEAGKVAKVTAG